MPSQSSHLQSASSLVVASQRSYSASSLPPGATLSRARLVYGVTATSEPDRAERAAMALAERDALVAKALRGKTEPSLDARVAKRQEQLKARRARYGLDAKERATVTKCFTEDEIKEVTRLLFDEGLDAVEAYALARAKFGKRT